MFIKRMLAFMLMMITLLTIAACPAYAAAPTPTPTPRPTPTPVPTPVPTPGVAEVIAEEGEMTVGGVPAYTDKAQLDITGTATASEEVTVRVGDKTLGKTTVKKDGTFAITVKLPEAAASCAESSPSNCSVMAFATSSFLFSRLRRYVRRSKSALKTWSSQLPVISLR